MTWTARAVPAAALASTLLLGACGTFGDSPDTTPATVTVTPGQDSPRSASASTSQGSSTASADAACGGTAQDAVTSALADLPRPAPEMAWDASSADTQGYDPCASLSAVAVVIERPTGSSPKHLLLFHEGTYVGTATKEPVSQLSDVVRVSDGQFTARLGEGSGAGATLPAPTTIRWDDTDNAVVVTDATSTPSAGGTVSRSSCAGSPALPGVGSRVCSSAPSGAEPLTINPGTGFAEFTSPSTNIMCEMATDYVECVLISPSARIVLDATGPAHRNQGTHPVTTFDRSTLAYGQVGTRGQFACLSEQVGVSCWNTGNGHGMFLAKERTVLW